jgi:hypothetical protein
MTKFQIIGVDVCRYVEKNIRFFAYIVVMSSITLRSSQLLVCDVREVICNGRKQVLNSVLKHTMAL